MPWSRAPSAKKTVGVLRASGTAWADASNTISIAGAERFVDGWPAAHGKSGVLAVDVSSFTSRGNMSASSNTGTPTNVSYIRSLCQHARSAGFTQLVLAVDTTPGNYNGATTKNSCAVYSTGKRTKYGSRRSRQQLTDLYRRATDTRQRYPAALYDANSPAHALWTAFMAQDHTRRTLTAYRACLEECWKTASGALAAIGDSNRQLPGTITAFTAAARTALCTYTLLKNSGGTMGIARADDYRDVYGAAVALTLAQGFLSVDTGPPGTGHAADHAPGRPDRHAIVSYGSWTATFDARGNLEPDVAPCVFREGDHRIMSITAGMPEQALVVTNDYDHAALGVCRGLLEAPELAPHVFVFMSVKAATPETPVCIHVNCELLSRAYRTIGADPETGRERICYGLSIALGGFIIGGEHCSGPRGLGPAKYVARVLRAAETRQAPPISLRRKAGHDWAALSTVRALGVTQACELIDDASGLRFSLPHTSRGSLARLWPALKGCKDAALPATAAAHALRCEACSAVRITRRAIACVFGLIG